VAASITSATLGCSIIPTDKEVLQKWLKSGPMENRTLFSTEAGTPQGRNHLAYVGEPDTRRAGAASQADLPATEDRWEDAQS
jgi:hypothetical protein